MIGLLAKILETEKDGKTKFIYVLFACLFLSPCVILILLFYRSSLAGVDQACQLLLVLISDSLIFAVTYGFSLSRYFAIVKKDDKSVMIGENKKILITDNIVFSLIKMCELSVFIIVIYCMYTYMFCLHIKYAEIVIPTISFGIINARLGLKWLIVIIFRLYQEVYCYIIKSYKSKK